MLLRPSTHKRIFLTGTTSNSNTKLSNSTATVYSPSLKHYLSTSSIAHASFGSSSSSSTSNTNTTNSSIPRPDFRKTNPLTTTKLLNDELNFNNSVNNTGGCGAKDDGQAHRSSRPYPPFGAYWHAKARLIEPLEPSASGSAAATAITQQPQERFTPTHTPTSSISSVQSASTITRTQCSSPASSVTSSSRKRHHHHHNHYVQQPGPDIQYVLTELARREQSILDLKLEVAALEADLESFKSQVFPAVAPPSPAPSEKSAASMPSSASTTPGSEEVAVSSVKTDTTFSVYKTLVNNVSMLNVGIGLWALGFGLGKQFVFGY